jgi:hypothetical protein
MELFVQRKLSDYGSFHLEQFSNDHTTVFNSQASQFLLLFRFFTDNLECYNYDGTKHFFKPLLNGYVDLVFVKLIGHKRPQIFSPTVIFVATDKTILFHNL